MTLSRTPWPGSSRGGAPRTTSRSRSSRSPSSTRTIPTGRSSSADTSATDLGRRHSRRIAKCSGLTGPGTSPAATSAPTSATRSNRSPAGAVRPPVTAYGRTTGPASSSSHRCADSTSVPARGVGTRRPLLVRAETQPDRRDQHRHLVRDQPDVGRRLRQHGQAGALPRGRHQHELRLQLDDRLTYRATPEPLPDTPRETLEPGRHGRQVLAVVAGQPV